jgi:hypothetical protein
MRATFLVVLCATLVCSLVACSSTVERSSVRDGAEGGRQVPYWVEGTTPARVAQRMNLSIPPRAADVRAAQQRGFQDDGLLLAFTLPEAETEALIRELDPDTPLTHRARPLASVDKRKPPTTPFAHLGLPEPEALADVTEGPVCLPCQGDLDWLNIAVHPLGTRLNRVYLSGAD